MNDVRVMGVHGDLIFCGITNETLVVGEGDIRRGCAVSLIVCNDFYTIILPDTNATRKEMMSDCAMKQKMRDTYE